MSVNWPTPPPPPQQPRTPPSSAPIQSRRGMVDRISAMQARVTRIHGFIKVVGGGGSFTTTDVNFPVWFMEMPVVSFGWSLEVNQVIDPTDPTYFPAGVVRWKLEERPMQVEYWSGATIGITGFGPVDQKGVVHWLAEGMALRSPTFGSGSVTPETPL